MTRSPLDDELLGLVTETNEQRRRVGQALWHFYRSLVFWRERGRTFHEIAKAWAPGGAAIFQALVTSLRALAPHRRDEPLRAYVGAVLAQLAADLERGDHMVVPFLRWIEGRFPELTDMMRAEDSESRVYDLALAQALRAAFAELADADRAGTVARLREAAAEVVRPE